MPDSTNPEWTRSFPPTRPKRSVWLGLAWISAIGLLALASAAGPDGHERADLAQFFGRFHPIVVHLPIGLILLVPGLELLGSGQRRPDLKAAAGLVLALATAAALGAAADGWLLAWSGGYKGPLVIHHMWGGVIFAATCVLCCTLRKSTPAATPSSPAGSNAPVAEATNAFAPWPAANSQSPFLNRLYTLSLICALGVLTWASHLGGSLSHGDNYLTKYLPSTFKRILHIAAAKAAAPGAISPAPATVYARQIQPIFNHSCVSCHGPDKVKGGFRLDTYAGLMKGGDNGVDVLPWQPAKSELLRRINLPADDDDFMPSNGKNVLTDDQKAQLEKWISAGASDRQPLLDR